MDDSPSIPAEMTLWAPFFLDTATSADAQRLLDYRVAVPLDPAFHMLQVAVLCLALNQPPPFLCCPDPVDWIDRLSNTLARGMLSMAQHQPFDPPWATLRAYQADGEAQILAGPLDERRDKGYQLLALMQGLAGLEQIQLQGLRAGVPYFKQARVFSSYTSHRVLMDSLSLCAYVLSQLGAFV